MGILDRFQEKLAQRKVIVQKERAIEREAYQKERLKVVKQKGVERARAGGFTERAAKGIKNFSKNIAKKNKVKNGLGFTGPNLGTPKDDDLFTVKDFRKKE